MKKLLLIMFVAAAILSGCKKESADSNISSRIKFTRADISGAKYLAVAGGEVGNASAGKAGAGNSGTLFKVDEKGNMTGVTFYIEPIHDDEGNQTGEVEVSVDISVSPKYIMDYGEKYLLFAECEIKALTDKYQNAISNSGYYESYKNYFLIRKSDGAIFQISPQDIGNFPCNNANKTLNDLRYKLHYNTKGDLYMVGGGRVSKLKLENDKLLLQTLTQQDGAHFLLLDKYDNFYAAQGGYYGSFSTGSNLYFASGGVMQIDDRNDNQRSITLIDNELYCIEYKSAYSHQDGSQYICDYTFNVLKLPTQLPSHPTGANFDVIATLSTQQNDNYVIFDEIHESKTHVVIYGSLIYDKTTRTLSTRDFPSEFALRRSSMEYRSSDSYDENGIAYQLQNNNTKIVKYNIFDLTKQTIMCDRSGVPAFISSGSEQTATEFIEYGIKNSNGAPIRVHTELVTGRVSVYEDTDSRTITELIKVS